MTTERESLAALIAQLPQRAREPLLRAFESADVFAPRSSHVEGGEHLLRILHLAHKVTTVVHMTPLGYLELAGEIILYIGDLVSGSEPRNELAALRGQLEGLAGYQASKTAGTTGMCGKCHSKWDPSTHEHVFGIGATKCRTVLK